MTEEKLHNLLRMELSCRNWLPMLQCFESFYCEIPEALYMLGFVLAKLCW